MIRSMTGFGRSERIFDNKLIAVEIKTVNHRYNDVFLKLPRQMNPLESKIRETLSKSVTRGKIDLYVKYENHRDNQQQIAVDESALKAYLDNFKYLSKKYKLKNDITMASIMRIPDIMQVTAVTETEDELWKMLSPVLNDAITSLMKMRETEGAKLRINIIDCINETKELLSGIKERAPLLPAEYRLKLQNRLKELIDSEMVDENRIAAETAIFADRCAVDEEIVRLESHFDQVIESLEPSATPNGKKLDFLSQEMNREANTIGSKANDLEIINRVMNIKCLIEKIREQVQNIE